MKVSRPHGFHYYCPCDVDVWARDRASFEVEYARHRNFHDNQARRLVGQPEKEFIVPEEINPNTTVAWLAYYGDWSGFALFANETECLRYAVKNSMQVALIPLGMDVREAVASTLTTV